jgi:acyl-CoA thioesterase
MVGHALSGQFRVGAKVDKSWIPLYGGYVVGPALSGQAEGTALGG